MTDEQFLWNIANEVEELLLNKANRKVFEQYADEFHKEWSLYKEAMMQWGVKARECIEKASKDERWRNEKAGPPETGYEWDGAHRCWLQPSPILPTLRLKVGHGGIVPRNVTENLKRSYLWLIIIHDAELQNCVSPIDKNSEPLAGHIGIFEGNLAVRNKHVLLGGETYNGRPLIETALTEVKSDLASPSMNTEDHSTKKVFFNNFIKATIKHLPYVGPWLFDIIYGVDGVKTPQKKGADLENKKPIRKEHEHPYIKTGGDIIAGGDIIVGNENVKDSPTKNKEKWYQNRTIQAAFITAFTAMLVGIITIIVKYDGLDKIGENQNSGQKAIIPNARDNNIQFIQNQSVDPNLVDKYGESQKALGKTEKELEVKKRENQELQNVVNAYKQEDKGKRAALELAENIEKTKIIVKIFQEQDKGNITKEKALKFSNMVNKTLWDDLKSFIENKNIEIDEHNQSLVVSGIFKAKISGVFPMLPHPSEGKIIYVLTPDGNELYEIAKAVNLE